MRVINYVNYRLKYRLLPDYIKIIKKLDPPNKDRVSED